ncbi:hypothetical protein CSKR_105258 [Clonorchis sinensis]|uniref:Uncharacterized protein n=1 Tax=Clonorchis sinensis TaxID=79923 RepID=A0A419PMC4_CLOSI|nr:hypothetical protein CSKR_105258 [Clonorchis sinensis]
MYLEHRNNWNMRRPGAAHSVPWKNHKREIQLGSRNADTRIKTMDSQSYKPQKHVQNWLFLLKDSSIAQWVRHEINDWKVRGLNPTSASRLLLPRLPQSGSILGSVLSSGGMDTMHRRVLQLINNLQKLPYKSRGPTRMFEFVVDETMRRTLEPMCSNCCS